jgi:hypothetical protein
MEQWRSRVRNCKRSVQGMVLEHQCECSHGSMHKPFASDSDSGIQSVCASPTCMTMPPQGNLRLLSAMHWHSVWQLVIALLSSLAVAAAQGTDQVTNKIVFAVGALSNTAVNRTSRHLTLCMAASQCAGVHCRH